MPKWASGRGDCKRPANANVEPFGGIPGVECQVLKSITKNQSAYGTNHAQAYLSPEVIHNFR